jgi:RNA-binding protein YhbY
LGQNCVIWRHGFTHQRADTSFQSSGPAAPGHAEGRQGGLSPQFLAALDDALKHHELVKVKFDFLKEQKKELAPQLAEKSGSHLVTRVGNVVVLFRPKPVEPQPA